jgi:hypothetical protein
MVKVSIPMSEIRLTMKVLTRIQIRVMIETVSKQ